MSNSQEAPSEDEVKFAILEAVAERLHKIESAWVSVLTSNPSSDQAEDLKKRATTHYASLPDADKDELLSDAMFLIRELFISEEEEAKALNPDEPH